MKKGIVALLLLLVIGGGIYYAITAFGNNKPTVEPEDDGPKAPQPAALKMSAPIVHEHDTRSYTEGLEFYKGRLYESGGEVGKSILLVRDIKTGKNIKEKILDKTIFAEGITILNNKLYQLTYRDNKVFIYDPETLNQTGTLPWTLGEGWGMTNDGKSLIANTGGSTIYFLDPNNLAVQRTINVTNQYGPVGNVNEMEYVDGYIFANVFQTDDIIKINPQNGQVVAQASFSSLLPEYNQLSSNGKEGYVMNGIAYNPETKTFFLTGKYWPKMFEVTLQ
jgi:glutaminyl-peptide cyclotransferase